MKRIFCLIALLSLTLTAATCYALDFSADMVTTAGGQRMTGKIYVAKDKVRIDTMGTTTITRMDKNVSWVLMPQQGMYMEQPIDPDKIAATAEKMPGEVERVSLGPDTLDGRATTKYRIAYTSSAGRAVVIQWTDNKSGIPIKTSSEDGSWVMEYKNLKLGAPEASLFELPSGYQKFAMPNMDDIMRAARQQ